ncbi:hypothetical protein MMH89_00055 [Candidatus Comchoanobacter bicostacola]|uniref:Uncharacterized protein n=1 Tax=Candidatus Comchoanobacter bicostacola TaxID=2919598 RepID=A0ABY5DK77_9GAMM|nr:hypothetical protein [Candidatus Comchoanobacter bicostacola]UTC24560.1 hypothetical protein MMH89_00055 [Candidatus Comchoanobacter bicostacola]
MSLLTFLASPERAASILKGEPTTLIKAGGFFARLFINSKPHKLRFASTTEDVAKRIAEVAVKQLVAPVANTTALEGGEPALDERLSDLLTHLSRPDYLQKIYEKYHQRKVDIARFEKYEMLATPGVLKPSVIITRIVQLIADLELDPSKTEKMCTWLSQFSDELDAKLALANGSTQLILECMPQLIQNLQHQTDPADKLSHLVTRLSRNSFGAPARHIPYQPISQTATIAEAAISFAALNPEVVKALTDHISTFKAGSLIGPQAFEGAASLAHEIVSNGDIEILCELLDSDSPKTPEDTVKIVALAAKMQPHTLNRFIQCACSLPVVGPKIANSSLRKIHEQVLLSSELLHTHSDAATQITSQVQKIIAAVTQLQANPSDIEGFVIEFESALTHLFELNRTHGVAIQQGIEIAMSMSQKLGSESIATYLKTLGNLFSLVGEDEDNDKLIVRRIIDVTRCALKTPEDTDDPEFPGCIAKTAIGALCIVDSMKRPDSSQDLTDIYSLFQLIMPSGAKDALGILKLILDPEKTRPAFGLHQLADLEPAQINNVGQFVINLSENIQHFPEVDKDTPSHVIQPAIEGIFNTIAMLNHVSPAMLRHILTTSQTAIVDNPALAQRQWLGFMAKSIPLAQFAPALLGKAPAITDLMIRSARGDSVVDIGLRGFVLAKSLPPQFFEEPEALEALIELAASDINSNKDVQINARALQAAITKLRTSDPERSGFAVVTRLISRLNANTPTQLLTMWQQFNTEDWVGMSTTLREVDSNDLSIICDDLSTLLTPLSIGEPMRDWVDAFITINQAIDLNEDQRKEIINSMIKVKTLYKTSLPEATSLLINNVLSPLLKTNNGDLSIVSTIISSLGYKDPIGKILDPLQELSKDEFEQFGKWLKEQGSVFAVQFSDIKDNSIEENQMLAVSETLYTALGASWSALDTTREQNDKFTRIANAINTNLQDAGYKKAAQAFSVAREVPQALKQSTANLIESIIKHLEGEQYSVWSIFKRILDWISKMLMHDPALAKIRLAGSITLAAFIISFIVAISLLASTAFIVASVFLGITSLLMVTAISAFIYKGVLALFIAMRTKKSVTKISAFLSNHLKDKEPGEQIIALTALCDALFNTNAHNSERKMHVEIIDRNLELYETCYNEMQPVIDNIKKQKIPPRLLIGPLAGKAMELVPGGRKTPFELLQMVNNIFKSSSTKEPSPARANTLQTTGAICSNNRDKSGATDGQDDDNTHAP